jgi:hypothetical protein
MREKKVYTVREVTALTGFFNTPAPPKSPLCPAPVRPFVSSEAN